MSKPAAQLSDVELKDHGNKLFAARKYDDAISCYNKAIVRRNKVKIFINLTTFSHSFPFKYTTHLKIYIFIYTQAKC